MKTLGQQDLFGHIFRSEGTDAPQLCYDFGCDAQRLEVFRAAMHNAMTHSS
jgi:hypothetical protein